jgi:hypothetical protein
MRTEVDRIEKEGLPMSGRGVEAGGEGGGMRRAKERQKGRSRFCIFATVNGFKLAHFRTRYRCQY